MIPKTIHYCWFGRNPKPALAVKCMKSWEKYCKGYEIVEWNEDTFSIADAPLYVRQAYEAKKWAFVTDYVRLYAMVNYGGIYMDTDVEVIKSLDPYLKHQAFSGFENEKNISTGIMACEKDFPLFRKLLAYYDDASFLNADGTLNTTTNVIIITEMCRQMGFVGNNTYQDLEGFAVYPKDVFCPIEYNTMKLKKTKNTATIHWFAGSWMEEEHQKELKAYRKKTARREFNKKMSSMFAVPISLLKKLIGTERYEKIRNKIK